MGITKKEFRITPHEARTLIWWLNRRNKIDMNPSYQRRGRLWSDSDKAFLIDSILNGFDIPKLYVADFNWGESNLNVQRLPYAIIDGKQRFEAIFDFFDGTIVLNEKFVYLDDPTLKLGGLSYRDLKQNYSDIAEIFDNYNLSIMSVMAKSEDPINELFVRLNRSKSLTGAEIRNAMSGPAPAIIRQIAKHDFFKENIKFSVKRGQDLNTAAKLLLFEYQKSVGETKKNTLDSFVDATKNDTDLVQLAGRLVADKLEDLATIFLPKDNLLAFAGIIPVYYWFIRGMDTVKYHYIREFIVDFERTRNTNRKQIGTELQNPNIDKKLLEYDSYNRNPNDGQSYKGRVEILNDRFEAYYTRMQVLKRLAT